MDHVMYQIFRIIISYQQKYETMTDKHICEQN